jgi:hypothetical protein
VPHRHILFWAMNDSSTIVSETAPEASAAPTRGCPPFHYLCFVCPKSLPPSSLMSSRAPPLTPSTLMTTNDPNFTNRGYVEEEITMEGDGVPVHHTFGGYSLFSPELKPNSSDGGPILPPSNEMRAEGILLRSPLPRLR